MLGDTLSLEFEPVSPSADLGGVRAQVARVRGEASGRRVDGLGTVSRPRCRRSGRSSTRSEASPRWWTSSTRWWRSRGGRAARSATATRRWSPGWSRTTTLLEVEQARISTVYDGGGRQRSAGLELWLPGEDFPRRGSGQVIAGSSLDLDALQVHVAVFRWRLDGREGIGAYELMLRMEPPAAA